MKKLTNDELKESILLKHWKHANNIQGDLTESIVHGAMEEYTQQKMNESVVALSQIISAIEDTLDWMKRNRPNIAGMGGPISLLKQRLEEAKAVLKSKQ